MLNAPQLTVAIPTYNRAESLKNVLDALQTEDLTLFKIIISDNSSSNATEQLASTYKNALPNLFYSKNKENLGYSLNVMRLYDLADTEYIWYLCDDDHVAPGAIQKILESLRDLKPTVAIFNCEWVDSLGIKNTAGVKKTRVYDQISEFNNYDSFIRLTFLSIIVVKKVASIRPILNNPKSKLNVFIQLAICFYLLSKPDNFKFCEVSKTIVIRNTGYKYGEFFKFNLLDPLKAIELIPHRFNGGKFKNIFIRHLPTTFLLFASQKVGLFHYDGRVSLRTLADLIKYYHAYSIPIIFLSFLCWLTPSFFIRIAFFLKLLFTHRNLKEANRKYKLLSNRIKNDERVTGFSSHP